MKHALTESSIWNRHFHEDITYIKTHLRFPWKRGMKQPLIISTASLIISLTSIIFILLVDHDTGARAGLIIVSVASIVCALLFIRKYLGSLRFLELPTGLPEVANRQLIGDFLSQRHFRVYQHPGNASLMQVFSRPVTAETRQRETILFLADKRRILVNSHFTDTTWVMPLTTKSQPVINALKAYLISAIPSVS